MSLSSQQNFDFLIKEEPINYKELLGKYLPFWPWFILSVLLSYGGAFLFLRYTPNIYKTEAKIKMLEGSQKSAVALELSSLLNQGNLKLENDIALFKSYKIAEKVVRNLDLNVTYFTQGQFSLRQEFDAPFRLHFATSKGELNKTLSFKVTPRNAGYEITNTQNGKSIQTKGFTFLNPTSDFPIYLEPNQFSKQKLIKDLEYEVKVTPVSNAAKNLSNSLTVETDGKSSDIILISLQHPDGPQAQKVINNLIRVFEEDGIQDNQLVSKRTIEFVDERFKYISRELIDIEVEKRNYKKNNNLSFVEGDVASSIQLKSTKEQALFEIETQLLIAKMLKENLNSQKGLELLPSSIGIQNANVNESIARYNSSVLEIEKLKSSAGINNPAVQIGLKQLGDQKNIIINSINDYYKQLQTTRNQNNIAEINASSSFESMPEKERVLRDIDRQQKLKESLYLLLLQKREEASISLAITQPNTKIIDYAISDETPIFPKKQTIFLLALLIGLAAPICVIYLIHLFDNKIYLANDIEKINKVIPILAELPSYLSGSEFEEKESLVQNLEAFRTLAHNTEFVTPYQENKQGKIFFVTSAIKGEGKTFVAYNLANAYAYLNKKTLIVGCDLRNPQLHKHLAESRKSNKGLSNYLYDGSIQWQDLIINKQVDEYSFDVLLAGDIPPNPTLLLSSERFGELINDSKSIYDIIIFDTPPTLLVTDSLIISKYADTTIYVTRSGVTDKELIKYSSKLFQDKKITNMGYLVNDIHFKRSYGYGYNYNYSYNYGYGYGYGRDVEKSSWVKSITNIVSKKRKKS
ncbi:MAG: hypothetical protein RIQ61_1468 [Bacteroidota bacterium]|jgi:capsular exopolysaccharide synthesis family protein